MLRLGKGCVPHCLRPQSLQSGARGLHVRSPVLQGVAADQPRAPRTWRAPVFGEPYQRQLALAPPAGSMLHRSVTDSDLAAWPITHLTRLDNGLRVATEEGVGETAAVGVFIDTGSRYETAETNGVAHFLEHMFFKGTPKRSVHQLEVEIENMGGHLNAYTSREQTVFYMRVLKKDVPQAMDILSDTLQNSVFDQDMITQESYTIMREMEEVEKQDEEVIFDRLHQTAFRGCSLARTILGPAGNILNMKRDHLLNYVRTHYTTPRMVVAGAGAVKHQDLCKLTQSLFTKFPAEPPAGLVVHKEPAQHIGGDIRVRDDDKDAATLALAFATPGWTSGENIVLLVMQTMLGSWNQGSASGVASLFPLVSQVAANDFAQSFAAFNTQYSDIGLFGVHARADKFQLWELTSAILHYMTSFCYDVDETLLNAAKHQLVSSVLGSLDNCQGTCEDIGRQMLTYGRRMHPIEFVKRIQAVDAAAIKATANRYIYDQDVSMACLGPVHEMPDYNRLRSSTYWLRK